MQIQAAHLQHQGISFAVFSADARTHMNSDRDTLLAQLVMIARTQFQWKVDKAALAYREGSQVRFYGTPDLVRFLANVGVPQWTHTVSLP